MTKNYNESFPDPIKPVIPTPKHRVIPEAVKTSHSRGPYRESYNLPRAFLNIIIPKSQHYHSQVSTLSFPSLNIIIPKSQHCHSRGPYRESYNLPRAFLNIIIPKSQHCHSRGF